MKTFIVSLLLLLTIHNAAAKDVEINDKVRDNFGIAVVTVSKAKIARQWQATAQVQDATALVSAISDLRAEQAASVAAESELKRVEALQQADNNVAIKVVEAARAQAIAHRTKLQTLRAQVLRDWGSTVARMSDASMDTLVQQLVTDRTVLVRAEVAGAPVNLAVQSLHLNLPNDDTQLSGKLLGSMPQRNEQVVGHAYLLSVEQNRASELQTGQVLQVEMSDVAHGWSGIAIPRSAIVRWQGQDWVYVQTAANHYQRKIVQVVQWQEHSAFIATGLNAGDKVVSVGAGLLLGAENAPPEIKAETEAKE